MMLNAQIIVWWTNSLHFYVWFGLGEPIFMILFSFSFADAHRDYINVTLSLRVRLFNTQYSNGYLL